LASKGTIESSVLPIVIIKIMIKGVVSVKFVLEKSVQCVALLIFVIVFSPYSASHGQSAGSGSWANQCKKWEDWSHVWWFQYASSCEARNFKESNVCVSRGFFGCHMHEEYPGGGLPVVSVSGWPSQAAAYAANLPSHSLSAPAPLASANNNGQSGCNNYTPHPINISTGSKFFVQSNFIGRGINPLRFSIYYNSNSSEAVWTSNYRQSLIITSDVIESKRTDGQVLAFTVSGGVITAPSQRSERLVFNGDSYELTFSNNTLESYNTAGQLLSIRYPNGLTHTLNYGTDTVTITRKNDSLVLGLTGDNVTSATLPDGSVINYTYDTAGDFDRLRTVTYVDNTTRTYAYDNASFPSYITSIQDANGNTISTVQYDSEGRAISSEVGELNSGIERSQIEYHDDGTRTVTNALGKQNIYHFTQFNGEYKMTQVEGQASANCASANQAYTYDANGFMASKTDWKGNVTRYIYNDRGLETSRTEASGAPEARTILTEWHATLNLRTKVTEPERETVFVYDAEGRLTSTEVSPR
jgi:YD repeat-containing protein